MTTLSEAVGGPRRVIGGPFGSKLTTRDYTADGIPVIRGGNMEVDGRWIGGDYAFVSEEKVARDLKTNLAHPGDIIVTQRGTLGQVSIVPDNSKYTRFVISQSQMAISVDHACVDRDYLYYFLRSPAFADYSHTQTIQTGVPHINLGILRDAPLKIRPLLEQRIIARILGALDDKIELNRRMSATLEEMARTLYRSWFVDFDPVHSRALGQSPACMGATTAALFPDSFGPDGLPKGWTKLPASDVVTLTKGRSYKSKELQPSKIALISLKSFQRGGGYRPDGLKEYVGDYKGNQVVLPGELVISLTDVTQAAEVIGRATFARGGTGHETLVASLDVGILRPIDEERTPPEFLHQVFNSDDFLAHAMAHVTGTTVLHLAKNAIPDYEIMLPQGRVIRAFEEVANTFRKRILDAEIESQTLTNLRDTLLPRLMSGELRIRDAEKKIEEYL